VGAGEDPATLLETWGGIMRRAIASAAVLVAVVCLAQVQASAASPPTILKFPKGTFDLGNLNEGATGPVCAFPVDVVVHALGGGHEILFNGQGVGFAGMSFGAFRLDITNLDTGKTVSVNSSGPGWITADEVPTLGRGPWVIFEPIAEGGLRFFHGVTRFVPTSYGVHAIPISGTEQNLCDLVA
jgi:hypothetical protein